MCAAAVSCPGWSGGSRTEPGREIVTRAESIYAGE